MSDSRIERLTREVTGPAKRTTYTKFDDTLLRAIGIVILVVTVVAFASWPREDPSAGTRNTAKSHPSSGSRGAFEPAAVLVADHTPVY
jgi:hypothetical protein